MPPRIFWIDCGSWQGAMFRRSAREAGRLAGRLGCEEPRAWVVEGRSARVRPLSAGEARAFAHGHATGAREAACAA